MSPKKQMRLAAFLNAGPQGTAGWRHSEASQAMLSAAHYQHIARVLEDAKFDLAFIPDALSVPRSLGGSFAPAVTWGAGTPRLDPLPVVTLMAAVTTHLGVAATVSTGWQEPYNLARSLRHARPPDRRADGMECRHQFPGCRGAEFRPGQIACAQPTLRPGRGVPGSHHAALG